MDLFRVWSIWEGALCHIGTRPVKLIGLSSKSICNISCIWSDLGTVLATVPGVQFAVPAESTQERKRLPRVSTVSTKLPHPCLPQHFPSWVKEVWI